ncbi:hypothetical protein M6D81_31585, partial [Paenibacillus sp. J5C_2022]|uniref:hypothetical protein n=1 Tax=Paenibacillus sp. J5C2022 TaxID=2977129 RepID=UPI0021D04333
SSYNRLCKIFLLFFQLIRTVEKGSREFPVGAHLEGSAHGLKEASASSFLIYPFHLFYRFASNEEAEVKYQSLLLQYINS